MRGIHVCCRALLAVCGLPATLIAGTSPSPGVLRACLVGVYLCLLLAQALFLGGFTCKQKVCRADVAGLFCIRFGQGGIVATRARAACNFVSSTNTLSLLAVIGHFAGSAILLRRLVGVTPPQR